MSTGAMVRVTAQTAAEVCARFPAGATAKGLLTDGMLPKPFLDLLIAQGEFADAVRFLAHGLPKREAVWWACRSARAADPEPAAPILAAIQAAEAWVIDPTEDNRRAAQPAAEAAEVRTPAGCASMAAFWSGGSLGPPNVPAIPPGEHLTAHGVAGAVMLSAVAAGPKTEEAYKERLEQGIRIAEGQDLWTEPARVPKPAAPSALKPSPKTSRPTINWE